MEAVFGVNVSPHLAAQAVCPAPQAVCPAPPGCCDGLQVRARRLLFDHTVQNAM